MDELIYVHYGAKVFNPYLVGPIENWTIPWTKPRRAFWASRLNASYGWKKWCADECFRECSDDCKILFKIKDGANVVRVSTRKDLEQLPKAPTPNGVAPYLSSYDGYFIDFEKCLANGIDAIELCSYGDEFPNSENLYYALYGWDCDSICILNPDIVVPLE